MTIAIADLATEKAVAHCRKLDKDDAFYLSGNPEGLNAYFDDLRPQANAVLIDKYAPFLSSRPEMAVGVVDPILAAVINEFAVSDLDWEGCLQTDILLESLHSLPAEQSATVLTIFLRRQAETDPSDDWFKACPVETR